MDESIWRLLVSDGRRCLSSLQEPDACSASGMFEEWHCKVTSWLETRKPIVQWGLEKHMERSARRMGLNTWPGFVLEPSSRTLLSAIAPLEPWPLYCEALQVAPLRTVQLTWSLALCTLFRWLSDGLGLRKVVPKAARIHRRHRLVHHIASTYTAVVDAQALPGMASQGGAPRSLTGDRYQ